MYTKVKSLVIANQKIITINVEANISRGMFAFKVLGVTSTYEKKIKEKINSIFKTYGQKLPNKKMIFNIESIDQKYDYDLLDLPILIALLKLLKIHDFKDEYYIGSLGIKGDLEGLKYPYRIINYISYQKNVKVNIPYDKSLVTNNNTNRILMFKSVLDLINDKFYQLKNIDELSLSEEKKQLDVNAIVGQDRLVRALIISLVGKHHTIVSGVSGTGKSLSFKSIESLLPNLNYQEQLLVNSYTKNFEKFKTKLNLIEVEKNISLAEFSGSKSKISLLNKNIGGFLILDEINLYPKSILTKVKSLMDINPESEVDDRFNTILANMNPCPCGNYGSKYKKCTCSTGMINSFKNKIDKPFLERFQIRVKTDSEFNKNEYDKQNKYDITEIKNKIKSAWDIQKIRYNNEIFSYNAFIKGRDLSSLIKLDKQIESRLDEFVKFYKFSMREKHNIIRVARSIADYEGCQDIKLEHLSEAVSYQIN